MYADISDSVLLRGIFRQCPIDRTDYHLSVCLSILTPGKAQQNQQKPSVYSALAVQNNHPHPITAFNPAEIHNADSIPPELLLNQPPTIAPTSKVITAPARRFRLILPVGPVNSCWSPPRSKYTLVSTTDGISFSPSARVAAKLPALWNASNAIGISSRKSRPETSFSVSAISCGIRSAWINATAMIIRIVWIWKEVKRVPRRKGPRNRVRRVKLIVPVKKATSETRDFNHPQGLFAGWFEAPRPRKTVFPFYSALAPDETDPWMCPGNKVGRDRDSPVCMPKKQAQAL